MRCKLVIAGLVALVAAALLMAWFSRSARQPGDYVPPDGALVTYFAAPNDNDTVPLVLAGTLDPGFVRPFLLAFQKGHPSIPIAYIQAKGDAFLSRALDSCHRGEPAADLYLASSTDHLVRLANENCAEILPSAVGAAAPAHAVWRNQVVAFTVEPAAFVFARPQNGDSRTLPSSHMALLSWLRGLEKGHDRIGTYDIEASADGYDFAASDSRQAALYGRILESLSRTDTRLYCCSNVMVDAVDRGEILFAYNIQLSYAYAAQRAGSRIIVVVPDDYQALQTLSFMVPRHARSPATAEQLGAFLVSEEARELARKRLSPPGTKPSVATAYADQLLSQASVTPLLLSLQDRSRREHLIAEWRQAIRPLAARVPAAGDGGPVPNSTISEERRR